ncbi:MAG: murein hydrolase activator EnvC family protein, partial [Acidimicrobiales bacterium]
VVAAVVAVAIAPAPTVALADERLDAAQRRANRAAADLNAAEVELAKVQAERDRVETRVRNVEARTSQTHEQVQDLALRLYVEGPAPLTRILRMQDANQLVRVRQFTSVIAGSSTDSLELYRAQRQDLQVEQRALAASEQAQEGALEGLRQRRTDAIREVERLAEVVRQEQERAAREAAAAQARIPAQSNGQSNAGGGTQPASPGVAAPSSAPAAPSVLGSGAWICPVQGPRAFSDDYGAARWGGGSHMGNDILSPRGTPVVANVGGTVTHRNGSVSGLSYFLSGDDGNRYFGAHLDSFGASGRVSAGTVIGTVGNTGDASGGPPHLHFEIHPGGSGYTNPYPTLSRYC